MRKVDCTEKEKILPEELAVGDSISQTLWYSCLNNWDEKDLVLSPELMKIDFALSTVEFDWVSFERCSIFEAVGSNLDQIILF